jgi:7,8-dihydropterin-6-yl-methyl-4-(beta-D-ribofuranosyl)aminobenzene 5'-phosphate synthase
MSHIEIELLEVDSVQVTVVMDNTIDMLMSPTEVAKRFPMRSNPLERPIPIAEHGFSLLVQVQQDDKTSAVLFDGGASRKGIINNFDALEADPEDIQAIILSHGHFDHTMGLPDFIERLGARTVPVVLHPDVYLERKLLLPNGAEFVLPPPRVEDFRREYIAVIEEPEPSMLVNDMVLVSGEIARTTEFERGVPIHYAKRNDIWEPDPLIMDDQCLIINVRDKGLVIITGCGHSGIINTIVHAQALTGIQSVYAVIGGFHLSGELFEPTIPATIAALQEIEPNYIMPGHCTGWLAIHEIARAMPEAFIPNSVGTTLML